MGALTFVGRIVLVVLNIIFILTSLALIIGGFILKFGNEVLRPRIESVLDDIENAAQSVYSDSSFNLDDFDYSALVSDLAIAMICVGFALLAVSFLGCFSACCNISTLALVYAIILIALFLGQVVLIILIYAAPDTFKTHLNSKLVDSIDKYEGLRGTTTTSMGWNFAMQQYSCCGANNYADFENRGTWKTSSTDGTNNLTPTTCCKTLPSDSSGMSACAGDTTDTRYDTTAKIENLSNLNNGCTDAIWKSVINDQNAKYIPVIVFCLGAQLALIIFAILIFKDRGITGGLI